MRSLDPRGTSPNGGIPRQSRTGQGCGLEENSRTVSYECDALKTKPTLRKASQGRARLATITKVHRFSSLTCASGSYLAQFTACAADSAPASRRGVDEGGESGRVSSRSTGSSLGRSPLRRRRGRSAGGQRAIPRLARAFPSDPVSRQGPGRRDPRRPRRDDRVRPRAIVPDVLGADDPYGDRGVASDCAVRLGPRRRERVDQNTSTDVPTGIAHPTLPSLDALLRSHPAGLGASM